MSEGVSEVGSSQEREGAGEDREEAMVRAAMAAEQKGTRGDKDGCRGNEREGVARAGNGGCKWGGTDRENGQ